MCPTYSELAWAAGIFDGEGSIGVYRQVDRPYRLTVRINMCHKETIYRFQTIVGRGTVRYVVPKQRNRRPYWCWVANSTGAVEVIRLIMPYLVTKAAQAKLVYPWPIVDKSYVAGKLRWEKSRA